MSKNSSKATQPRLIVKDAAGKLCWQGVPGAKYTVTEVDCILRITTSSPGVSKVCVAAFAPGTWGRWMFTDNNPEDC